MVGGGGVIVRQSAPRPILRGRGHVRAHREQIDAAGAGVWFGLSGLLLRWSCEGIAWWVPCDVATIEV